MGRWVSRRTAKSARRMVLVALLGVLVVAAVGGYALAKTSVDTTPPTVSSINRVGGSPSNASSFSWSVSFSEPVTGVSASNFAVVVSGATTAGSVALSGSGSSYTVSTTAGGGDGTILLQLKSAGASSIKDAAGNALTGAPISGQAYSIDRSAPAAPAITAKPVSLANSASASFAFTGETGASFLCKLDGGAFGACSSPQSYSSLSQGGHMFSVQAKDAAGNVGPAVSYTWTVDSVAPVAPTLTTFPDDPNGSAISTFAWSASEAGLTYQCSIENGPFQTCTSPTTFTVIVDSSNNQQHQFAVRALDQAGNVGAAASYKWKVDKSIGFTISGSLTDSLYPGKVVPLNLVLTNPNNFQITVGNVVVTVADATTRNNAPNPACVGSTNLRVNRALLGTVTLPANSSKTLSQLSVAQANWPQLELADLPVNQDACKNTRFTLNYTGSATK